MESLVKSVVNPSSAIQVSLRGFSLKKVGLGTCFLFALAFSFYSLFLEELSKIPSS